MKNSIKFLSVLAMFAAVACAKDNTEKKDDNSIKFSVSVSKATDTAFEDGDQISLFAGQPVNASNVKMTYSASALTPSRTLYWADGQTAATEFNAVYPYNSSYTSFDVDFEVNADQSTEAGYKASDLMTAATSQTPGNTVNLNFSHKLAKLVINITNTTEYTITGVTAEAVKTKYNCGSEQSSGSASVKGFKLSESSWTMILAPQTAAGRITVQTTGGEFDCTGTFALESGREATCNITISGGDDPDPEAAKFSCTVSDWGAGQTFTFTQEGFTPTPVPPVGSTVTINALSTELSWVADTHSTYGAGFKGTGSEVTVAYYKYNAESDLVIPTDQYPNIKVYKGAILIIKLNNGAAIKSVKMKCSGTSSKSYTADMEVIGGGIISADESTYTLSWTGSATELAAVASVAQVRPETLEITY